jgi:FkbM family methyltransferase
MRGSPKVASVNSHTVLVSHLAVGGGFVDLGANRGAFASKAERDLGLSPLLLVEANPGLVNALTASGHRNVRHCAVSSRSGAVALNLAENDEGSSVKTLPEQSSLGCVAVGSVQVPAVTLETLLESIAPSKIDLLKVDIEGAEVDVLLSAPDAVLQRFAQISVEFHCHPVFGFGGAAEVQLVISRMKGLGFDCISFNSMLTDVLFVNHRALRLSRYERMRIRLLAPPSPRVASMWMALPASVRGLLKRTLRPGAAGR